MKILIVDDEKDMQRLFEQRFRREIRQGLIKLYFAINGTQALRFLEDGGAQVVTMLLSDINMPEMSGFDLLRIIRKRYPRLSVLMISAYRDEEHRKQAFALGADDFFSKPLDFQELKQKILRNID